SPNFFRENLRVGPSSRSIGGSRSPRFVAENRRKSRGSSKLDCMATAPRRYWLAPPSERCRTVSVRVAVPPSRSRSAEKGIADSREEASARGRTASESLSAANNEGIPGVRTRSSRRRAYAHRVHDPPARLAIERAGRGHRGLLRRLVLGRHPRRE